MEIDEANEEVQEAFEEAETYLDWELQRSPNEQGPLIQTAEDRDDWICFKWLQLHLKESEPRIWHNYVREFVSQHIRNQETGRRRYDDWPEYRYSSFAGGIHRLIVFLPVGTIITRDTNVWTFAWSNRVVSVVSEDEHHTTAVVGFVKALFAHGIDPNE